MQIVCAVLNHSLDNFLFLQKYVRITVGNNLKLLQSVYI